MVTLTWLKKFVMAIMRMMAASPDVAGFAFVTRSKDYRLLDHPLIQARLHLSPDQVQQRPESQMVRNLYDCPQIPVGPDGVLCRVIVATHPAGKKKSPIGVTRAGMVYKRFFTNLQQDGFTACDVVELYLHRGAFEPTLADKDLEQDPDRWCSHSAWGTGVLATGLAMGVEPQIGIGAPVGTNTPTHHRTRSRPPRTGCPGYCTSGLIRSCLWIRSTYHRHCLQNRSVHRSRFSSPAR